MTDPAQAFAALREQFGAATDAITDPNARYSTPHAMPAESLRTVPMPDLRGGLRAHYDTRTGDERILAELVRIVDALQGVELRLGLIEETLRGWREDE